MKPDLNLFSPIMNIYIYINNVVRSYHRCSALIAKMIIRSMENTYACSVKLPRANGKPL